MMIRKANTVNVTTQKTRPNRNRITVEDIQKGYETIMKTIATTTTALSRFDSVFIGKQKFISTHVPIDGFAYVLRTMHPNIDARNTETIKQLSKIFFTNENAFVRAVAGIALWRLGWDVTLPMSRKEIIQAMHTLIELSVQTGNDIVKTYC